MGLAAQMTLQDRLLPRLDRLNRASQSSAHRQATLWIRSRHKTSETFWRNLSFSHRTEAKLRAASVTAAITGGPDAATVTAATVAARANLRSALIDIGGPHHHWDQFVTKCLHYR